jgi:hypothetical protein
MKQQKLTGSKLVLMKNILKKNILAAIISVVISGLALNGQTPWWKEGITVDEFIYNVAPYPECHASTIAEAPEGLVAAWFGGTKERNPDVGIWYAALILEDSPISQYSYPSVIQTSDGMVHFVYTWRRERIKHVVADPSKFVLKKIENGQWPY